MELKAIREWARQIDVEKVDVKKKHHAQCYKDMIETKIGMIEKATSNISNWQDNLVEYLQQLERVGVSMKKEEPQQEEPLEPEEKTTSPLLPDDDPITSAKEEDQHSEKGTEESKKSEKVVRKSRIPRRSSTTQPVE